MALRKAVLIAVLGLTAAFGLTGAHRRKRSGSTVIRDASKSIGVSKIRIGASTMSAVKVRFRDDKPSICTAKINPFVDRSASIHALTAAT